MSRSRQIVAAPVTALLTLALLSCTAFSKDFFVAPDGRDASPGTLAAPFASVQRAQEAVSPGDTVYFRGGTYAVTDQQIARRERIWAYVFDISKSGTKDAPIRYWAYKDETPVFDFSAVKPGGLRVIGFFVPASCIHFRGLEVRGVQVTIKTHTQSECFENQGDHNVYERLSLHDGQAIGIYLIKGSNNLFLNCDAFRNHDFTSENGRGGNTDGFGCHPPKGGVGNVFRGCRAWFNSDDGYDCINAAESVTFENCWSFYNGFSTDFKSLGDGNGFKAGGYGATPVERLPSPIPRHTVRFCLAVHSKANGFYANHHVGGADWFNNSAYRNSTDFNMLERLPDNKTDVPGKGQKMRNNVGYKGGRELTNLAESGNDVTNNSFDMNLKLTDADFESLDEKQLVLPRQPNGELPAIGFMHPSKNSQLIDRGVNVGFPFKGTKPDLGAFER